MASASINPCNSTYNSTNNMHLHLADWLGTRRVSTDASGNMEESCTSYPFGDGLSCAGDSDPTEQHFTGKERDSESGLDYFGARHLSSNMGRFMTSDLDQESGIGHVDDPQGWNGYAYGHNNPLVFIDPDGEDYTVCSTDRRCGNIGSAEFGSESTQSIAYGEHFDDGTMFHLDSDGNHVIDGTFLISQVTLLTVESQEVVGWIKGKRCGVCVRILPMYS